MSALARVADSSRTSPDVREVPLPDQVHRTKNSYSITSSARASRIGGTLRPSAFAVLRLTDGNIFVGNSIGKSIRPSKKFRRKDMKRCALCHGKLGLSARFRNIWNGRWWVHVRFCSVRCEVIYEVTRNDAAKHRWHAFLARGNSRT